MKIADKKYILFDLDGTITDSMPGITNSVKYALAKFGIYEGDQSVLQKFVGPPLLGSFINFYGFSPEKAQQAVVYYREYYPDHGMFECTIYDGIINLFEKLRKTDKHIILATAKPELYTKKILEHFDLIKYFHFVAGSDFTNTRSEKEQVIAYALKKYGITNTDECIMIGDRCYDINGAHINKMEAIGVLYGYGSKSELEEYHAEYLAESVYELGKLLGID